MEIKCCMEVSKSLVYNTFLEGFSDYPVKPPEEAAFFERFFGPEGNRLEYSFIALKDGHGVGLILGGIRNFDGLKTLRCGTMCIIPKLRGSGVAEKLWESHRVLAREQGCKQLFLEVIGNNERAIKFYEKNGYEKRYLLKYYQYNGIEKVQIIKNESIIDGYSVKSIDFETLKNFREVEFKGLHINWQNEIDYIKYIEADILGVYDLDKLIGAICYKKGKIFFIGVDEAYRGRCVGSKLVETVLNKKNNNISEISFPNNASLEGFCKKNGLVLASIFQYEMYRVL